VDALRTDASSNPADGRLFVSGSRQRQRAQKSLRLRTGQGAKLAASSAAQVFQMAVRASNQASRTPNFAASGPFVFPFFPLGSDDQQLVSIIMRLLSL